MKEDNPKPKPKAIEILKIFGLIFIGLVFAFSRGSDPAAFGIPKVFLFGLLIVIGGPYFIWVMRGYFIKPRRKPHSNLLPEDSIGEPSEEPTTVRLDRQNAERNRTEYYLLKPYAILVLIALAVLMGLYRFELIK